MTQAKVAELRKQFDVGDKVRVKFRGYAGGPAAIKQGVIQDMERTCVVVNVDGRARKVKFENVELLKRAEDLKSEPQAPDPVEAEIARQNKALEAMAAAKLKRQQERDAANFVRTRYVTEDAAKEQAPLTSRPFESIALPIVEAPPPDDADDDDDDDDNDIEPATAAAPEVPTFPRQALPDDFKAWIEMGLGMVNSTKDRINKLKHEAWECRQRSKKLNAEADALALTIKAFEKVANKATGTDTE